MGIFNGLGEQRRKSKLEMKIIIGSRE